MSKRLTSSKAQNLGAEKTEKGKEIEIIEIVEVVSNLFIHFLQLVKTSSRWVTYRHRERIFLSE